MIPASGWLDRWEALGRPFPFLPRWAAALILALLAAAMITSVLALPSAGETPRLPVGSPAVAAPSLPTRAGGDMALYARIHARVAGGEGYYAAALAEQRASNYPTRPFVAVRLPTLAWVQAVVGASGVRVLAIMVAAVGLAVLNGRAVPFATLTERLAASLLLILGGGAALSPLAGYDHDFIAGLLLTLSLLLYRPERWWPALLAAGAALAVRELAASFVLVWLAVALAARRWREAASVAALLAVSAGVMGLHFLAVEAGRQNGDLVSQGWSAHSGFGLPLAALAKLTGLRFLPAAVAAPLAILPLMGWAGLGGRIGLFAVVWFAGLATAMALFARPENYYWAQLALPAYALGLAFSPRGIAELALRVARQT
ncbi:MAG: hypothetical protein EAY70_04500 [Sphingomonadales bacterium]|nr:MAG: hypothetical protein EAY70_04500 [Sphingomonadales bacterium]